MARNGLENAPRRQHLTHLRVSEGNGGEEHRISVGAYGRAKLREYLQKLAGGERFDIGANLHSVRAEQEQLGVREVYGLEQLKNGCIYLSNTQPDDVVREHCSKAHPGRGCTACTSCHFCRQKTVEVKPGCKQCTLYWCSNCLWARYGENSEEVLQMEDWKCPCCRHICNCSGNCQRSDRGYLATGQLTHEARRLNYPGVCMYLILTAASDSLRHMSPAQIDDAVSSLVEPILHSGMPRRLGTGRVHRQEQGQLLQRRAPGDDARTRLHLHFQAMQQRMQDARNNALRMVQAMQPQAPVLGLLGQPGWGGAAAVPQPGEQGQWAGGQGGEDDDEDDDEDVYPLLMGTHRAQQRPGPRGAGLQPPAPPAQPGRAAPGGGGAAAAPAMLEPVLPDGVNHNHAAAVPRQALGAQVAQRPHVPAAAWAPALLTGPNARGEAAVPTHRGAGMATAFSGVIAAEQQHRVQQPVQQQPIARAVKAGHVPAGRQGGVAMLHVAAARPDAFMAGGAPPAQVPANAAAPAPARRASGLGFGVHLTGAEPPGTEQQQQQQVHQELGGLHLLQGVAASAAGAPAARQPHARSRHPPGAAGAGHRAGQGRQGPLAWPRPDVDEQPPAQRRRFSPPGAGAEQMLTHRPAAGAQARSMSRGPSAEPPDVWMRDEGQVNDLVDPSEQEPGHQHPYQPGDPVLLPGGDSPQPRPGRRPAPAGGLAAAAGEAQDEVQAVNQQQLGADYPAAGPAAAPAPGEVGLGMMDAAPEQDTGSAEDTSFQDWLEVVQEAVHKWKTDLASDALTEEEKQQSMQALRRRLGWALHRVMEFQGQLDEPLAITDMDFVAAEALSAEGQDQHMIRNQASSCVELRTATQLSHALKLFSTLVDHLPDDHSQALYDLPRMVFGRDIFIDFSRCSVEARTWLSTCGMTLVTALCRRNRQHVSEALSGLLDMLQAIVIDYIALEKYDQQPEQLSQMPVVKLAGIHYQQRPAPSLSVVGGSGHSRQAGTDAQLQQTLREMISISALGHRDMVFMLLTGLQVLIPELGAGSCHLLGAWLQDVLRPEGPADMSVRKAALGLVSSVLHQYPLLNRGPGALEGTNTVTGAVQAYVRQPLELYVALSNKHRLAPQAAQGYLSVVPTKAHVEALENEPFVRKHLHSIKDELRSVCEDLLGTVYGFIVPRDGARWQVLERLVCLPMSTLKGWTEGMIQPAARHLTRTLLWKASLQLEALDAFQGTWGLPKLLWHVWLVTLFEGLTDSERASSLAPLHAFLGRQPEVQRLLHVAAQQAVHNRTAAAVLGPPTPESLRNSREFEQQQQQGQQIPGVAAAGNQLDPVALKRRELETLFREGPLRRDKRGVVRAAALAALLVGTQFSPAGPAAFQLLPLSADINDMLKKRDKELKLLRQYRPVTPKQLLMSQHSVVALLLPLLRAQSHRQHGPDPVWMDLAARCLEMCSTSLAQMWSSAVLLPAGVPSLPDAPSEPQPNWQLASVIKSSAFYLLGPVLSAMCACLSIIQWTHWGLTCLTCEQCNRHGPPQQVPAQPHMGGAPARPPCFHYLQRPRNRDAKLQDVQQQLIRLVRLAVELPILLRSEQADHQGRAVMDHMAVSLVSLLLGRRQPGIAGQAAQQESAPAIHWVLPSNGMVQGCNLPRAHLLLQWLLAEPCWMAVKLGRVRGLVGHLRLYRYVLAELENNAQELEGLGSPWTSWFLPGVLWPSVRLFMSVAAAARPTPALPEHAAIPELVELWLELVPVLARRGLLPASPPAGKGPAKNQGRCASSLVGPVPQGNLTAALQLALCAAMTCAACALQAELGLARTQQQQEEQGAATAAALPPGVMVKVSLYGPEVAELTMNNILGFPPSADQEKTYASDIYTAPGTEYTPPADMGYKVLQPLLNLATCLTSTCPLGSGATWASVLLPALHSLLTAPGVGARRDQYLGQYNGLVEAEAQARRLAEQHQAQVPAQGPLQQVDEQQGGNPAGPAADLPPPTWSRLQPWAAEQQQRRQEQAREEERKREERRRLFEGAMTVPQVVQAYRTGAIAASSTVTVAGWHIQCSKWTPTGDLGVYLLQHDAVPEQGKRAPTVTVLAPTQHAERVKSALQDGNPQALEPSTGMAQHIMVGYTSLSLCKASTHASGLFFKVTDATEVQVEPPLRAEVRQELKHGWSSYQARWAIRHQQPGRSSEAAGPLQAQLNRGVSGSAAVPATASQQGERVRRTAGAPQPLQQPVGNHAVGQSQAGHGRPGIGQRQMPSLYPRLPQGPLPSSQHQGSLQVTQNLPTGASLVETPDYGAP